METQATTAVAPGMPAGALATQGLGTIDTEKAAARDILIPKILLMQPVSKFVADEKAKQGELRVSLDAALLAEKGKLVEFIPFHRYKTRVTFKKLNGKQEFAGQVPWAPAFETQERKEIVDGTEYEHFETLNYYVLLVGDIAKDEGFPYLISFRSTGYKAGKAMETYRTKLQMAQKSVLDKVFTIGTDQTKNDKGTFWVPIVGMTRNSTDAEKAAVKNWQTLIAASNVKVDDSDLETGESHADNVDESKMNTNF